MTGLSPTTPAQPQPPGTVPASRPPLAPRSRKIAIIVGLIAFPPVAFGLGVAIIAGYILHIDLTTGWSVDIDTPPRPNMTPERALMLCGFIAAGLIMAVAAGLSSFLVMKRLRIARPGGVTATGLAHALPVSSFASFALLNTPAAFLSSLSAPFVTMLGMFVVVNVMIGALAWWLAADYVRPSSPQEGAGSGTVTV